MADLAGIIEQMHHRITELERRAANIMRIGVVEEVNAGAGTAKVKFQDGDKPFISGDLPWAEIAAGSMKTHNPPASGQQVIVFSPTGDLSDAIITAGLNSSSNARPSSSGDVTTLAAIGDVEVTVGEGGLTITAGGVTVAIGGDGLAVEGGQVTHNGKDVGDTHKHGDITKGSQDSGVPV